MGFGRLGIGLLLSATIACASIKGSSDLEHEPFPASGEPDGSSDEAPGDADDDDEGGLDADGGAPADPTPADDGNSPTDAGGEPSADDGSDGAEDASPHMPEEPDASEEPVPNQCAGARNLSLPAQGGSARASGDTSGAPDSQAAPCQGLLGLPGPDHIYAITMPFMGELEITATPSGLLSTFQPSVYLLGACDDAGRALGCDFTGKLGFSTLGTRAAGEQLFVYVDSGGQNLFGLSTPVQGAYELEVAARKLVGEGEPCGSGRTDPQCLGGRVCRAEGQVRVCRQPMCGDGVAEGAEECDGEAGCSEACKWQGEACADALALQFTAQGATRVARFAGTTVGKRDDGRRQCANSSAGDQFFSLELSEAADVTIEVLGSGGFDPVVALYRGECSALSQLACVDSTEGGGRELIEQGALPAGAYTLVVDGYDADGAYDLTVTLAP